MFGRSSGVSILELPFGWKIPMWICPSSLDRTLDDKSDIITLSYSGSSLLITALNIDMSGFTFFVHALSISGLSLCLTPRYPQAHVIPAFKTSYMVHSPAVI